MKKEEQKTSNPSAFPLLSPVDRIMNEGMTLIDYYAGQAMQAMISNPNISRPGEEESDFMLFSERSYRYANAMLKQREL